jgi:transcriptional regulator of acetoin/glycerol metabolism
MSDEIGLIMAKARTRPPQRVPGRGNGEAGEFPLARLGTLRAGNGPVEGGADGRDVFNLFVDSLCRERPILLKELMDRIEKDIIIRSLRMADGNQKQAAGILGVKYTTLHEKLKKFGIRFRKTPVPFAF